MIESAGGNQEHSGIMFYVGEGIHIRPEEDDYEQTRFYAGIVLRADPEEDRVDLDERWVEVLPLYDSAMQPYSTLDECMGVIADAAIDGKLEVLRDPEYIRMDEIDSELRDQLRVGASVHVHTYRVRREGEYGPYDCFSNILCAPNVANVLTEAEIEQVKLIQADEIIASAKARYEEIKTIHDQHMAKIPPVYPGMTFALAHEIALERVYGEDDTPISPPRVLRINELIEPMVFYAVFRHSPYKEDIPVPEVSPFAHVLPGERDSPLTQILTIEGRDVQGGTISYSKQPLILEIEGQYWYSTPDEQVFIMAVATGPNTDVARWNVFYRLDTEEARRAIDGTSSIKIPPSAQGYRLVVPVDEEKLAKINAVFLEDPSQITP